jgi:hypothetical protein
MTCASLCQGITCVSNAAQSVFAWLSDTRWTEDSSHQSAGSLCSLYAVYVQSVCSLYAVYVQSMCNLCAVYMQSMCSLYADCVQSMCSLCAVYMQFMCSLCVVYVQSICSADDINNWKLTTWQVRGQSSYLESSLFQRYKITPTSYYRHIYVKDIEQSLTSLAMHTCS